MEIIKKEYVKVNLELQDKEEVLSYIAALAFNLGISQNSEETLKDLRKREEEFETALGSFMAIPHTKSVSIVEPSVLVLKSRMLIKWSEEEGANTFIVLLTPKDNTGELHLKLLASLSRRLMNKEFKKRLIESLDEEEIYSLVSEALKSE